MPLGSCLVKNLKNSLIMTNFDRDEAVMKFARQLRGMGVDEALRARGAKMAISSGSVNLNLSL